MNRTFLHTYARRNVTKRYIKMCLYKYLYFCIRDFVNKTSHYQITIFASLLTIQGSECLYKRICCLYS